MKVYISFDIEGVSGITDPRDIDPASPRFPEAARLSTRDVNAAVEGALAAGATDVVVCDGHGRDRRNLLIEQLHPKAKLIRGRYSTEWLNMPAFDASYDAVFFVGWHTRSLKRGVLGHCLNSKVFTEWRVNGTPVGEPEFAAALAGQFNVPLVLVTGDDCLRDEIQAWNPACEYVVTKQFIDRFSAICLPIEETYAAIKQGAERALRRKDQIKPFHFNLPVRIEADTVLEHTASTLALVPGMKRIGPVTVCFETNDYVEAFQATQTMMLISILTES